MENEIRGSRKTLHQRKQRPQAYVELTLGCVVPKLTLSGHLLLQNSKSGCSEYWLKMKRRLCVFKSLKKSWKIVCVYLLITSITLNNEHLFSYMIFGFIAFNDHLLFLLLYKMEWQFELPEWSGTGDYWCCYCYCFYYPCDSFQPQNLLLIMAYTYLELLTNLANLLRFLSLEL